MDPGAVTVFYLKAFVIAGCRFAGKPVKPQTDNLTEPAC